MPIPGLIRTNQSIAIGDRVILAITNTGTSGTVCHRWISNGTLVNTTSFTIPTLAAADDAGGPTSGRAMKCGVTIQNTTQMLNRGGRVFVFNCASRVRVPAAPSTWTPVQFNTVFDQLAAMPTSQECDGAHFGEGKHNYCHVVDNTRFEDFDEWLGTYNTDDFSRHVMIWPGATVADRPMSTIFIMFDSPAIGQTYNISTRATFYTRWSVDTVLGALAKPLPTAPQDVINAHQSLAEKAGDALHLVEHVVGIDNIRSTIGAVGRGAMGLARGFLTAPPMPRMRRGPLMLAM